MAVLTDAQVTKRAAKPTHVVRVNGVPILPADANASDGVPGLEAWETEVSFDAPIKTARLIVNRIATWIDRGHSVTIDAGYEGVHERVFTGYVKARGEEDPDFARNRVRALGAEISTGQLVSVATLVGGNNLFKPAPPAGWYSEHEEQHPLADTQAKLDEYAQRMLARLARVPRRPAGDIERRTIHCVSQLDKAQRTIEMAARSFDLQTVSAAIGNVLDYVGITNRQIDSAFAGFTLGSQSVAQLERMPAIQMLQYLAKLIGSSTSPTAEGKFYDTDDGVTVFQVMDDLAPAASAFRTVSTETQAQAYIIDNTSHLVIPLDPRIKLGMTLGIVQPRLDLNGRFVVVGVKHMGGRGGFLTDLDLRGGDELGGNVGLNPVASFSYKVAMQVIGNALQAVISFVDQSYDPDGSIASRAWSDTHATTPEVSTFTGKSGQVRINAGTTGYQLTETVTDNDGLTRAVTQSIDLGAATAGDEQPALFVAQDVGAGGSPDGGQTWNDQASATCVAVDPKPADGVTSGVACYGFTDGSIKRTSDFCRTALTTVKAAAGADGTIKHIWWDKNVGTRVWAATSTGRLYKSEDDGVTWALFKDFGGAYPLNRVATPVVAQIGGMGGVWVFGGKGDASSTLIQFDAELDGVFVSPTIGGELATALSGASASITVAEAASNQFGELLVAFRGAAFPAGHQSLYYTNDIFGDGTAWKEATGTAAGSEWRWVAPSRTPGIFYGQVASSRHILKIDCTTGTPVVSQISNVLPADAGLTANHGIWEGGFIGGVNDVYLIAVETTAKDKGIFKWLAEEATASALRPATGFPACPANYKGQMVAIGAPARGTSLAGRVAATTRSASPRTVTKLLDTAVWDALTTMTGVTDNDPRPFWLKPNVCLVTNGNGTPAYSKDGGASFAALPSALARSLWFARDAGGRLWALVDDGAGNTKVYYSDDDGDTWNGGTGSLFVGSRQPLAIACHPTDQNRLVIFGSTVGIPSNSPWVYHSTTRGASWTEYTGGTRPNIGAGGVPWHYGLRYLQNGRIIASGPLAIGSPTQWRIMTSDDAGSTWTVRKSENSSSISYWSLGAAPSGLVVVMRQDQGGSPYVSEPLISMDFGNTFTQTALGQTLEAFTGTNTPIMKGMAYDHEDDRMYLALAASGFEVVALSPVGAVGAWVNLRDAIGSTNFGGGNLSVIPRA